MNCSKCNTKVGARDLFCPKCKKVLRLQCSSCSHITKNRICEKCGSFIINKCFKCGKFNSTSLEICPKCGLNINASIGLRESATDEFAALTIDIENIADLKRAFNSNVLADQFKKNFYNLIKKFAARKNLRVQVVGNTYIVRFCKDYSFFESCSSAIDFAIYVAQSITDINEKLFDAKGIAVKVKMAIQKRDVYAKPDEYHSGLNINLVYSSKRTSHLFNNVQVVVDSFVYRTTKSKYPYQSLSALYVKKQMVMFFELMLPELLKLEAEKEESYAMNLPQKISFEPEEDIDEGVLIKFSSIRSSFIKVKYDTVLDEAARIVTSGIKNPIVAVKGNDRTGRLWNFSRENFVSKFQTNSVHKFSCPEQTKYEPFGFLRNLVLAYNNVTEFDIMLNPDVANRISNDVYIGDLLLSTVSGNIHPEDMHYSFFEAFANFFAGIKERTIFVVEDFHFVDEGSLEIIKYLIENDNLGNVGFVFAHNEDFQLHRKIHKLMTSKSFYELELRLSSNKNIVAHHIKSIKDIEKSFYFEKILENTKGSNFYFTQALEYLTNTGVLSLRGEKYYVKQDKMIVLSKDLFDVIKKRIQNLSEDKDAYNLYISMLLLGENIPVEFLKRFNLKNPAKTIKYLELMGFVNIINNKVINIKYFGLYRRSLSELLEEDKFKEIAQSLLDNILYDINRTSRLKAEIVEYAGNKKEAFSIWNNLAEVSSKMGDFSAYLNTTNKYLSLVENIIIDEEADKTIEQAKLEVYEEMSAMLYKYYPDKILNFLELLLENLEKTQDDQKVKTVANKLVQSCLMSGNYTNAFEYVGKIISRTPQSSFNPSDKNFNLNYFLVNLVTLEIYYNLGRLNECIELGNELFKHIGLNNIVHTLLPEGFSTKQFKEAIVDAQFFICVSNIIQLKDNVIVELEKLQNFMPEYSCFKLLLLLAKFLHGENVENALRVFENADFTDDKYSQLVYPILLAMIALKRKDWDSLGNYIYQTKLVASSIHQYQIEYFADLMIGFAYQRMGNVKKSKQIYYSVMDSASSKGIKNITYLCWYLIALVENEEGNLEASLGLLNNASLNIEKDENSSSLFVVLFRSLMAEVLFKQHEFEKSLFCANQVYEIIVNKKLSINTVSTTRLLSSIYENLIATAKDQSTRDFYTQKIKKLSMV